MTQYLSLFFQLHISVDDTELRVSIGDVDGDVCTGWGGTVG